MGIEKNAVCPRLRAIKRIAAAIGCYMAFTGCSNHEPGAGTKHQHQPKAEADMSTNTNTADSGAKAADSVPGHAKYRRIKPAEAKKMMDENAGAIALDVRTEKEFKEGHIAKSVLLPLHDIIDGKAAGVLTDKEAVILVYCRRGNRSRTAANKLLAAGYVNVYDFGGIESWKFGIVR